MPLLSIIVPVYNVEKYLHICLDSLINQTLKDIEIIVVSDASPDNSEDIILEYAAQDSRIVYIKHEENKCLGGARNTGMKVAKGQYITFVDSDDYVDRRLYAAVIKAFKKYDVNVVSIPYRNFNEKGPLNLFYRPYKKVYSIDLPQVLGRTFYAAWSKVYRREDIERYALAFPEHIYWEDMPFWIEYCALMHPRVWNLHNKSGFYWYRQRKESITGANHRNYAQLPHAFTFLYQRFVQRGLINSYFDSLCEIIDKDSMYAWQILDDEYKDQYVFAFMGFLKQIDFNSFECKVVPVWKILAYTSSPDVQEFIFRLYMHQRSLENKLQTDRWCKFGRLPGAQKIGYVFIWSFRRLIKLFTFQK